MANPEEVALATTRPPSRSVARKSLLSLVAALAQGGVRFICNAAIGRYGGPAVLGPFASALALVQIAAICWPTPGASAASKFLSRARGEIDDDLVASIQRHLIKRLTLATGILLVGVSALWMAALGGGARDVIPLGALLVAYFAYTYTRGVQYGLDRVPTATRSDICSAAVAMLGVVVLLVSGIHNLWLLSPFVAGYGVAASMNFRRNRHVTAPLLATTRAEIDRFILLATIGMAASSGFLQLGLIMARLTGGPSGAGQYSAALALTAPFSLLASAVSNVLFPTMAALHGSGDSVSLRRQLDRSTRLFTWGLGLGLGVLVICRRPIVFAVWGRLFDGAVEIAPLLLMATWFGAIAVPSVNAITSGSQRGMVISAACSTTGFAVGCLVWFAFRHSESLMVVATGYAAGSAVISTIPLVLAWRRHAMRWATLCVRIASGAGVLAAYLLLLERVLPDSWWVGVGAALSWVVLWSLCFPGEIRTSWVILKHRGRTNG